MHSGSANPALLVTVRASKFCPVEFEVTAVCSHFGVVTMGQIGPGWARLARMGQIRLEWPRLGQSGRDWARMGQISQNWPEYSRMALISGQKSRFWDYFEHLGRLAPDITRMDLRGFILSIWAEVGTICSHFGVMPREVGRRSLSKTPLIYLQEAASAADLSETR